MSHFQEIQSGYDKPEITPLAADVDKDRYFENPWMFAGHSAPRVLVCGNSGCGKTTTILNLVLKGYLGEIETITLCAKSAFQGAYDSLHKLAESEPDSVFIYDKLDDLELNKERYNPEQRHVLIIDDFGGKGRKLESEKMKDLFFTGRHYNMCTFFLTQNFYRGCPLELRNNCSAFMLFRCTQGAAESRRLARFLADNGVSESLFMAAYDECTREKYQFMLVDKEQPDPRLRYRQGFCRALDI